MTTSVINLSSLNGSNGFRLDGEGFAGYSVSGAGDINGDGYDDVIIGAPSGKGLYGSTKVVFGKASSFDASLDLSNLDGSNGFSVGGSSGRSVSDAGDFNGDGFDDVIVADPFAGFGASGAGSSYIVFGNEFGFDARLNLANLNQENGFRIDGTIEGDRSGYSVSSAGDVNGDGYDDVIIGTIQEDRGNKGSPPTYVVFGKSSGFSTPLDLSILDGTDGFRMNGVLNGFYSRYFLESWSVSSAGDVNGDGFDDVVVGASLADSYSGASYVIFGKSSGFDDILDLSDLNGSNGFRLTGNFLLGKSVSSAGDINDDGFDDVIVASDSTDYILFGKGLGFEATIDLNSLNGSNGFRLEEEGGANNSSVSSAGDMNGDGFDDVIIGNSNASPNGSGSGSSYVVFGKSSGFSPVLNLTELDSESGFRLDGVGPDDHSGESVSNIGDMNGDGFDDVIIGAPLADPGGNYNAGSSYVVFGRSTFSDGNVINGTPGNDVLKGTLNADIIEAGNGNDLMIGRGGADVFRGGAGVDQIKVLDLSFQSIDGGTDTDILHLDGKDLYLDLASVGDKIQSIETICIYGRGDNTLALTADSVLNLSDTSNTLKLHGNAGDLVKVQDNGWVDGGVKGFYHTYTNDDAILLVGANLAIQFL
ncbi:MAG TPA: FG-GAP-like repeat-containing protein [Nitrosomonas sp.]|nr:FG-GAP-like repeat-containing protein [Nitrosomonas sp.]HRB78430.1 FG-GAP-like repeat-containing protein [Nitrosomonas sp.]